MDKTPKTEVRYDAKGFAYLYTFRDNIGNIIYVEDEKKVNKIEVINLGKPENLFNPPKHTIESLKKLGKDKQVQILKGFGLTDVVIRKLSKEDDRIKKILDLQK